MKIFIVEDDLNVIKILEKIVEDRELGEITGYAKDGIEAINKIIVYQPDIVLIDLLIPNKDGINVVKDFKNVNNKPVFIMISQVSSKDLIAKAYESGIEFFIQKPINAIEVENVIKKVNEKLEMQTKLNSIKKLFDSNKSNDESNEKNYEDKIISILQKIGILGETGSRDIVKIVMKLVENKQYKNDFTLKEVLKDYGSNTKTVEQRIRRAANVGLINLANLGIEDNLNEVFLEYSNSLYSFEQIKLEMDYIRGRSNKRGKINLKKFIEAICLYVISD
ncbi:response regulator [Soehngenia longivitae]|uniref:Response regulator n=1 Tax=Soehngenia longivitae TaxID=2562294 RepID=A0A4Z0D5N9_9FIRM|nr:response regulator [Soehngenia longivitae]